MYGLESINIQCPFCWETFEAIADCSVESQEYVEDCEVCCRPIVMKVEIDSEVYLILKSAEKVNITF